jgi:hypothetical protein
MSHDLQNTEGMFGNYICLLHYNPTEGVPTLT